ncbi:NmrA-like family domain-containing protein [Histoplasma capsulatum var. duboisii H88]|uniref:NmrA-like family domain-containing protein 1 n=1 Tax=Ajellomyces capsulatus (strain H88) TaxID=544711 RepID=F0UHJ4_AJEC8|nr:NmrA-like family domain-containing protein [Histoplasma capsulatum var. duboisii H88]QSS56050.1 NmrA-like family domain-containing protein [Histoplasma capsulatum var. duboisii H88]
MSKLITVFGATGNQGGSVIKAILAHPTLSKEFKIRGITRDPSKPSAQELANQGVEIMSADMSSPSSLAPALANAHTVFLVTNFWESAKPEVEYSQGKNVADAAKSAGVSHFIFSSLVNVTDVTQGRLPNVSHFDSKANVEKYVRSIGLPATFVLPGYFMSNFEKMLRKGEDGVFTLSLPVSENAQFPLFDAAGDTGKYVTAAMKKYPATLGKDIYEATDYYTPGRIVSEFTEVTGYPAKAVQITPEQYKSFMPPFAAQEFLENHQLLEGPGYYGGASLGESLAVLEQKPTSWKEYVEREKSRAWKA